jgi:hypothetical protein
MKKERVKVEAGQVWEDCDKRMTGRMVKVLRVFERLNARKHYMEEFAECVVVVLANGAVVKTFDRKVTIRTDRMHPHSTGFRLVLSNNRFEAWKKQAAEHCKKLVGIVDIWAKDDPYDLAKAAEAAMLANQSPFEFVEEVFAEDITRAEHEHQQADEALEAEFGEDE